MVTIKYWKIVYKNLLSCDCIIYENARFKINKNMINWDNNLIYGFAFISESDYSY